MKTSSSSVKESPAKIKEKRSATMYEQLLRPMANEATKDAMSAWARDVSKSIVAQLPKDGYPWKLFSYKDTLHEMIGSWKRVVFFVKTNWEGEIQNVKITFIFKIEGMFHIHGKMKAVVTSLPEVELDKELNDTPTQVQDAIIDTTQVMDRFKTEIEASTPETLRDRLVEEVPYLIENALACSAITAIALPHLRQNLPPK